MPCDKNLPTLESVACEMRTLGSKARFILRQTALDKKKPRVLKSPKNYEVELIQIAAVAIAALTDYRLSRDISQNQSCVESGILKDVFLERQRQDALFKRTLPAEIDPCIWGAVLIEEVAEVLDEIEI